MYEHVTLEPDCEQFDGSVARADPTNTTPHNSAKPAAVNDNAAIRPRARAGDKPNLLAPVKNIPDRP